MSRHSPIDVRSAKPVSGAKTAGESARVAGADYISQAVRTPDSYVTSATWENGDLSLKNTCLGDLWLVTLMMSVSPSIVPAGVATIRIWDTFKLVVPGADPTPASDRLLVEEATNPGALYRWEPPVLLMEEALMRYGDGRVVRTQYYLRWFFQFGLRVQLLDRVGAVYTPIADSMHITCLWMT